MGCRHEGCWLDVSYLSGPVFVRILCFDPLGSIFATSGPSRGSRGEQASAADGVQWGPWAMWSSRALTPGLGRCLLCTKAHIATATSEGPLSIL